MIPEDAKRILHEGAVLLEGMGLTWWLSAGTLLGAYRDGFSDAFLERDSDIDVGVLGDERYQEIKETLERAGFAVHTTYPLADHWPQLAMVKDGIIFDIYFFRPEGEMLVNVSSEGVMAKPAEMVEGLVMLFVDGHQYPAPGPIPDYLTLRYGPDWQRPRPKFACWAQGAANLIRWSRA